jgi:toxin-antitoxin system PIN domain toxin
LDLNVLLALTWPTHVHHQAAHRWFADNSDAGWATCPLTQLGFARLAMQPAVVKVPILFGDVMEALARITANRQHRFWPLEGGLADVRDEIRARIVGHHQLTDAVLLDLAIRNQGRLATFDRRVLGLLPPNSVVRDAVALIPA